MVLVKRKPKANIIPENSPYTTVLERTADGYMVHVTSQRTKLQSDVPIRRVWFKGTEAEAIALAIKVAAKKDERVAQGFEGLF